MKRFELIDLLVRVIACLEATMADDPEAPHDECAADLQTVIDALDMSAAS
jgi:hypothetical protein